ncbi:MAG: nuclear transport factor 2 family protein [Verrucomicrobiota bacterium]
MNAALEQEVQAAVESLFAALRARDLDAVMAHYAPADDIVCLGPSADDVSVGIHGVYSSVSRQVKQTHQIQCQYVHASAGFKGDVAWTIGQASIVFVLGTHNPSFQGRYTSVLEYSHDVSRWLIRHSLFSIPGGQQQSIAALFPSDLSNPVAPPPVANASSGGEDEASMLGSAEAATYGANTTLRPPPPPPNV